MKMAGKVFYRRQFTIRTLDNIKHIPKILKSVKYH